MSRDMHEPAKVLEALRAIDRGEITVELLGEWPDFNNCAYICKELACVFVVFVDSGCWDYLDSVMLANGDVANLWDKRGTIWGPSYDAWEDVRAYSAQDESRWPGGWY